MTAEEKAINHPDYNKVHLWIKSTYGKADRCENNSCTGKSQNYEWALLKGKDYAKLRENFWMLCCSCHRKYDFKEETRRKISDLMKGRTPVNKGQDSRFSKICHNCGKYYKHYKKESKTCSRSCAGYYREKLKRDG